MPKQNLANHVRYYPAHHFIFYPLLLAALTAAIYEYAHHADQRPVWLAVIVLFFFIGWTAFMLRQHYALGNQDRIVRLELRFRYYILTGKRFESVESRLSFAQLAALRFASDEELPALVERTLTEQLKAGEIKKSIVHWLPDTMRV